MGFRARLTRFLDPLWSFIPWVSGAFACVLAAVLLNEPITILDERLRTIRIAGMLLQVAGLVVATAGMFHRKRTLGRSSVWISTFEWLKHVFWPRSSIVGTAHVILPEFTGKAYGFVSPSREGTLEERLDALETWTKSIAESQSHLSRAIDDAKSEAVSKIKYEAHERKSDIRQIRELLDKALVGDARLEFGGILYVASGIVVTTLSEDLAGFWISILPRMPV